MSYADKIYEALINRNEKIRSKSEILKLIGEYKLRFKHKIDSETLLKYLSRHNYLKRIFHSYYYINSSDERKRGYCYFEDKELLFMVLNKLEIKWYVGLDSVKYLTSSNWQVPRVLHIINTAFSGEKQILSLKVNFSKLKLNLFFGLKKSETKNKITFKYSSAEKTELDMAYLQKKNNILITEKTKDYLKRYPKWLGKK